MMQFLQVSRLVGAALKVDLHLPWDLCVVSEPILWAAAPITCISHARPTGILPGSLLTQGAGSKVQRLSAWAPS